MGETDTVYKIVRIEDNLFSPRMVSPFTSGRYQIKYVQDAWVAPRIGLIFVYIDIHAAYKNLQNISRAADTSILPLQIWRCKPGSLLVPLRVSPIIWDEQIQKYWTQMYPYMRTNKQETSEYGTDRLMLLEQVGKA